MERRFFFALAALAVALPACSLAVSLDGLSDGVGGTPSDASIPVEPNGPDGPTSPPPSALDAAGETGGTDAEGADAGGTFGKDAAEAAPGEAATIPSLLGVRCADVPTAAFCDDFDGADLATVWGESPELTLGELAHDGSKSTSSPNSLRAEVDPTSSSHATATIRHTVSSASPMQGTLDLDMIVDQYGPGEAIVAYINLQSSNGSSSASYTLQLALTSDAVHLVEDLQGVGAEQNEGAPCPSSAIAAGTWHHFTFGYDLAAPSESVSVDGAPTCSRTLAYASSRAVPWEPAIELGVPWSNPGTAGTWILHQDSAVFRIP